MEAAQARLSLFMSKCHIGGNHMSRLKYDALSALIRIMFLSRMKWTMVTGTILDNSSLAVRQFALRVWSINCLSKQNIF